MTAPIEVVLTPALPLDLIGTVRHLGYGRYDPTIAMAANTAARATMTEDGPAVARLRRVGNDVHAIIDGPGAPALADRIGGWIGSEDSLQDWHPARYPLVAQLDHRFPGLRFTATKSVFEACVPIILGQRWTAQEAHRAWRSVAVTFGTRIDGLVAAPAASVLSAAPYWRLHPLGVERKRAEVIGFCATRSVRLEEAATMPPDDAMRRLLAFPGIGAWTAALIAQQAWADADAVPLGDWHFGRDVVYALTGREGGDDDAMLELLEPMRPHRARVIRLIGAAGIHAPRRAPGRAIHRFASR